MFKKLKNKLKSSKLVRRKRKFIASTSLGLVLAFGRPNLASAKLSNYKQDNQMVHKRVNPNKVREGSTTSPMNMETIGRQLSQEYLNYQLNFNSPPLSKRFDTIKFSQARFRDPK